MAEKEKPDTHPDTLYAYKSGSEEEFSHVYATEELWVSKQDKAQRFGVYKLVKVVEVTAEMKIQDV